jgi:hypothetical protein
MAQSEQFDTVLNGLMAAIELVITKLKTNSNSAETAQNALRLEGLSKDELLAVITGGTLATLADLESGLTQHAGNDSNPHGTTKDHVQLGLVQNLGLAMVSTLQGLTTEQLSAKNDAYLTPATGIVIANKVVEQLVGTAPEALDTIQEVAEALNNNPQVITEIFTSLGNKVNKSLLDDTIANLTKTSVGLDKVVNASFATIAQGENLNNETEYVNPKIAHHISETKTMSMMTAMTEKLNELSSDL